MTTQFRLFVSINLTPALLATLADQQNQLKRQLASQPLRWARPEGIHLTLKFLGDTETGRIEEIVRTLTRAVESHQPFELSIGGLGCFPNQRKPRVLWVGVQDPNDHLRRLAASSVEIADNLGVLPVQTIHLMRSQLQPDGAVYTSLLMIPLKNPVNGKQ